MKPDCGCGHGWWVHARAQAHLQRRVLPLVVHGNEYWEMCIFKAPNPALGLGIAKHCSALKNTFKMVPNRRRQDVQHGAAVENIGDVPAAGVVVNGCVVEQVDLTSRPNTASLKPSNHEISEKILPGGHWRSFPGKFNK